MTENTQPRVTVCPGADVPPELAAGLAAPRLRLWRCDRTMWLPRCAIARNEHGQVVGAALSCGRRLTAQRKIVDVISDDAVTWRALVAALLDDAPPVGDEHPAALVVQFEEHPAIAPLRESHHELLTELGFTRAATPVPSIPSTCADDEALVAVWSRWRDGISPTVAPYFGQTTEVTCGAVSLLMALGMRGVGEFSSTDVNLNRAIELDVWRRATNLPACEPIGLAVETVRLLQAAPGAMAGRAAGELARVYLSANDPVLLDEFSADGPAMRQLREQLQAQSRWQAQQLGLPIERRWLEVAEIAECVRDGATVLLLIDLTELINDPTPHWVVVTGMLGDAFIVADPWVEYPSGESWADTFAMPMYPEAVDRVTRWGDPAYRGVIVIPASPR